VGNRIRHRDHIGVEGNSVRIVVCNFCPNTFNRPKRSHRRQWLLSKPIDERRSYYRLQQRKGKMRLLVRRAA
jgi:hypothetical protein